MTMVALLDVLIDRVPWRGKGVVIIILVSFVDHVDKSIYEVHLS